MNKIIILSLFAFVFAIPAVALEATPTKVITGTFAQPITLRIGDKAVFPDDLNLTLVSIEDSRCKVTRQNNCVWRGELKGNFVVTEGGVDTNLSLGTVVNTTFVTQTHAFSLQNATTKSVTVTLWQVAQ